jgi:hypothetical protein
MQRRALIVDEEPATCDVIEKAAPPKAFKTNLGNNVRSIPWREDREPKH